MRFARDFTKLSEYFGPDDYDRNINLVENMNNNDTISPARGGKSSGAAYSPKKEERNNAMQMQKETKNISKIKLRNNNNKIRFANCFR